MTNRRITEKQISRAAQCVTNFRLKEIFLSLVVFGVSVFWTSGVLAGQVLNRTPGWPGTTLSGTECYGVSDETRFDYLTERDRLAIVENFHFFREVQELAQSDRQLAGNLDYTLKSIPNHHRALWVKVRFHLRLLRDESKRNRLIEAELRREGHPPPECYFHRGKAFNPGDGMVPAIFGIYLHKLKKYEAALAEYRVAEKLIPNHAELNYNMGLLYVEMGQLDEARASADKAEALGYPLRGLRRKIKAAELSTNRVKADDAVSED